ncbi:carbohydrate kinase [Oceanotoga sp. DSM 15011]|uniref:carbohydrate kinase family protein n=1 Tax=Oceanotoga sp. DSM 15011 TaxID=2984951 RepID=UPI0021F4A301|nr:carbohydrate kinase [Oceanotoga sp. DSM 15011]UYP01366.1 carbohydrate kinase [Oceanotoga sp. DSM 15011]
MNNIFCIGELLIDMVCTDKKGLKYGKKFEKKAGGAPANVAVAVSKLGGSSYFLGQVGKDFFGDFLIESLESYGVNIDMMIQKDTTTIALVGIDEFGERNFDFLRGGDGNYSYDLINFDRINDNDIIHFGSATGFLGGELEKTYFKLLNFANENNIFISFDPNYRDTLIEDKFLNDFIDKCIEFIKLSDFVKLSDDELFLITKRDTLEEGIEFLHDLGVKVITITLGDKGTLLSINKTKKIIPSISINQVDSTGAGDAFVGAVLFKLSSFDNKKDISFEEWEDIILFANKVGAITCSNYGAIESIPTLNEVDNL